MTSSTAPFDDGARRLAWLFRSSLRERQLHPLLHLVQHYRQTFGVLAHPVPPAPEPNPWLMHAPVVLSELQRQVTALPSLPQVVREIDELLHREQVHAADVAAHVEHDQALSARTLQLANSPFYGVSGRVRTVHEAVQVLGFDVVASLLTMAALQQRLPAAHCEGFDREAFWKHALATALMSRGIVQSLRGAGPIDEDEAFAAGLLHDIGLLLLTTRFPGPASMAQDHARRCDLPLHEAEQLVMGCDHAQVGTLLAGHWHFGETLVDAIAHHHAPPAAPWNAPPTVTDAVHAAHALVHALDLDGSDHAQVPALDLAAWQRLRLSDEQVLELLAMAEAGLRQVCEEVGL